MRYLSLLVVILLGGCAGRAPGPSQVHSRWNGEFQGRKLGIYFLMERGPYTVAEFECLSQADEALKQLDPGIRWVSVDSGHRGISRLGGWDLDSLGDLMRMDSSIWSGTSGGRKPELVIGAPNLSVATKVGLQRVRDAFGLDLVIAFRPGGSKNKKDSLDLFADPAWFGVFDLENQTQVYSLDVPVKGSRSTSRSAETDWARTAWTTFIGGIREVRSSRRGVR